MSTFPTSPRPPRSYDIKTIPERFTMDHSHAPSKLINMINQGWEFPRYDVKTKIVFEIRADDRKILESHEWLEKSRYCEECKEEIVYRFRLLRPDEKQQMTLRTGVTKKNPKGRKIL